MSWKNPFRSSDDNEMPLFTEVYGAGEETLVFVPGLGGTTRYWRSRTQPLETHYRIVLVDLLGFGQSPKPWTQYSVEHHVAELRAALESLGRVTLVGHSLGALLTIAYAARFPNQVKNIALLGMPYFSSQDQAYRYFRSGRVKGGYVYTNVVLTMAACIVTRRVLGWMLPYLVRSVPREVAEDLVKHTWRSSTSSLWEVVYRYDIAMDLDRLPNHISLMFIHGDKDVMAPLAQIERLAARRPAWRLWVLPGIDHHPFLRDPDGCLTVIDTLVATTGHSTGIVARSPALLRDT